MKIGNTGLTRKELNMLVAEKSGLHIYRVDKWVWVADSPVKTPRVFNPCEDPRDSWSAIEKSWDELIEVVFVRATKWEYVIDMHNCTKLEAAMLVYVGIE